MSRLLFAAARGSRIECQNQRYDMASSAWVPSGIWMPVDRLNLKYRDYRIHPDDEHLQYGPISATFIAWAMLEGSVHEEFVSACRAIADDHEADWAMHYDDELHRSLFLLILAEALADEGL